MPLQTRLVLALFPLVASRCQLRPRQNTLEGKQSAGHSAHRWNSPVSDVHSLRGNEPPSSITFLISILLLATKIKRNLAFFADNHGPGLGKILEQFRVFSLDPIPALSGVGQILLSRRQFGMAQVGLNFTRRRAVD